MGVVGRRGGAHPGEEGGEEERAASHVGAAQRGGGAWGRREKAIGFSVGLQLSGDITWFQTTT